jgi:uncharacterized membrane protein
MNLQWQRSIQTDAPVDQVYAYLADFSRHGEWSRTIERMEIVSPGDAEGLGARYLTRERVEFPSGKRWRHRLVRMATLPTACEVRELVPGRRIAWHARPVPSLGGWALLSFDMHPSDNGGTIVTQRVSEFYPRPVSLVMRLVFNVTADGIREQLDRTCDVLKSTLDSRPWETGEMSQAAGN